MLYKPLSDRLSDEVDAFYRLWSNRRWLAIVLIILLFCFFILSFYGWFQRGNKIDELKSEIKSLRETVAPLINHAVSAFPGEEINEALKKIVDRLESEDPLKKPIASASSTVEIVIESNEQINTHYIDRGGYLAFAKGADAILVTSANNSYARQKGNGEVVYSGVFQMPSTNSAVGKPIDFLESAEYLQISFRQIPNNSSVINGKAIIVVNGSQRFEFQVLPQRMQDDEIFVREISGFMRTDTK